MTPQGVFALVPCSASNNTLFWLFLHSVSIPTEGDTRDEWEEHLKTATESFKPTIITTLDSIRGQWGDVFRHAVENSETEILPYFQAPIDREVVEGAVSIARRC